MKMTIRLFKLIGYTGALVATLLILRLAAVLSLVGLLLFVSLAVVGEGNRLAWLAAFPIITAALMGVAWGVFIVIPEGNELLDIFLVSLFLSVLPALVICAAVRFRDCRAKFRQTFRLL